MWFLISLLVASGRAIWAIIWIIQICLPIGFLLLLPSLLHERIVADHLTDRLLREPLRLLSESIHDGLLQSCCKRPPAVPVSSEARITVGTFPSIAALPPRIR
jgi:hypothetical protein